MPWYRINGMHVHMRGKNLPASCCGRTKPANPIVPSRRCCAPSTALCDWPLEDGGTCDAPICPEHAHQVGPDRHYCDIHMARHRAAVPELF